MSDPKTIILLATYNEMENLPDLVDSLIHTLPGADILVVDDHSPDGTGDWIDEKRKSEARLFCIHRSGKNGLGSAVIEALQFAIDHKYDFAVNMDADFSHPADRIPMMIDRMNKEVNGSLPDIVIGSRYISGGGIQGWSLKRKLMSRAINFFARLMLGLKTKDNSGSFRCYRISFLEDFDFKSIRSRGYSFFEEFLFRLKRKGASFAEIPILFTDRTRGESKINRKEAITAVWILFSLGMKSLFSKR
ncbi:MAG: polyprenol monophosphomannose synthase [Planctomycetia bacterium]|nr:polyprenol monophosphomannose synthase [Planctomycetia bacterium]